MHLKSDLLLPRSNQSQQDYWPFRKTPDCVRCVGIYGYGRSPSRIYTDAIFITDWGNPGRWKFGGVCIGGEGKFHERDEEQGSFRNWDMECGTWGFKNSKGEGRREK